MTYGKELKKRLEQCGATQAELARFIGSEDNAVSKYVCGRMTPRDGRKKRIDDFFRTYTKKGGAIEYGKGGAIEYGKKLSEKMKMHDVKQIDLAEQIGVSVEALSYYVRGLWNPTDQRKLLIDSYFYLLETIESDKSTQKESDWVSEKEKPVPWSEEVMLKTADGWSGKGIFLEGEERVCPCRITEDGTTCVLFGTVTHWKPIQAEDEKHDTGKHDTGKHRLSLVPTQGIIDVAEVREYGLEKYGTSESWRTVEPQRYLDALYRHLLAMVDDMHSIDEESRLEHYKHVACNAMFLCELLKGGKEGHSKVLVCATCGKKIEYREIYYHFDRVLCADCLSWYTAMFSRDNRQIIVR